MDYDRLEGDILFLINMVRKDPSVIIPELKFMIAHFNGKQYQSPSANNIIITYEGQSAVKEAILFLSKQKPLHELVVNKGLCIAAKDHVEDLGSHGIVSHEGTDGSHVCHRVERYGEWQGSLAENIIVDDNTARNIVIGMIIDDGNVNRQQRNNIFSSIFNYIGLACGPHKLHKNITILNFAVDFKTNINAIKNIEAVIDGAIQRKASAKRREDNNTIRSKEFTSFKKDANDNQKFNGREKRDYALPSDAVSCKVRKIIKTVGDRRVITIIRTIIYRDGSQEIIEETEEE